MKDEEVRRYIGDENTWGDDLHRHFEEFGRWDWVDVKDEGNRLYGLMFDCTVEDDSPIDDLFAAVAAQASHGALSSVAACLGISAQALLHAVAPWAESQNDPPQPVANLEGFSELVKEAQGFLDSLRDQKKDE